MALPATIRHAVTGLVACLIVSPAFGFELLRTGRDPCDRASPHLAWEGAVAPIDVTRLGTDSRRQIAIDASERWNQSVQRFRFTDGTGDLCDATDGVITIGFSRSSCGGRPLGETLAITRFRWNQDGALTDSDIVLNPDAPLLDEPEVLHEVVMHELGHALGLDHSDACGDPGEGTLMRAAIVVGIGVPLFDRPQPDDIAGTNTIYPPLVATCPADCDRDGRVAVRELVQAVNGALQGTPLGCPAADSDGDGRVAIEELIRGLNAALDGCP